VTVEKARKKFGKKKRLETGNAGLPTKCNVNSIGGRDDQGQKTLIKREEAERGGKKTVERVIWPDRRQQG